MAETEKSGLLMGVKRSFSLSGVASKKDIRDLGLPGALEISQVINAALSRCLKCSLLCIFMSHSDPEIFFL